MDLNILGIHSGLKKKKKKRQKQDKITKYCSICVDQEMKECKVNFKVRLSYSLVH